MRGGGREESGESHGREVGTGRVTPSARAPCPLELKVMNPFLPFSRAFTPLPPRSLDLRAPLLRSFPSVTAVLQSPAHHLIPYAPRAIAAPASANG